MTQPPELIDVVQRATTGSYAVSCAFRRVYRFLDGVAPQECPGEETALVLRLVDGAYLTLGESFPFCPTPLEVVSLRWVQVPNATRIWLHQQTPRENS